MVEINNHIPAKDNIHLAKHNHAIGIKQIQMPYGGARVKGYLNNSILVDNSLIINVNYASHPVLIGGSYGAIPYGETISGNIPQVQIYNRALSASEIKQNYNATKKRYGL